MGDFADFDNSDLNEPQEGGGGFLKYCLMCGCLVALMVALAAGGGAWWIKQHLIIGSAATKANLAQTIDCEIPSGYDGIGGFNWQGLRASMIGPVGMQQGGNTVPALMAFVVELPPGADTDQVKRDIQNKMQVGAPSPGSVEAEEAVTVTVRGAAVEAAQKVETNAQNGQKVRQVFLLIDKGADDPTQVMLWFMGDDANFDQAAMDAFLQSIK